MRTELPSPRQLKRCSCPIIWRLLLLHAYFLDHTTVLHHALHPLLLCVPTFPCVSCVAQVGATVLLPWKDIVTSLKEYIHRDYGHRHFLGLLYGYYSLAMGYNARKYWYLDSHGTTVGEEAGVTYLHSTDLEHFVLDVLQADALNQSSWRDCGNRGCPCCNLAVTIVLIKRSAWVSASRSEPYSFLRKGVCISCNFGARRRCNMLLIVQFAHSEMRICATFCITMVCIPCHHLGST